MSSEFQPSFDSRICHASGERCLGCPHYYGKAPICSCSPDFKSGPEPKPTDWGVEISSYRQVGGDHYERMAIQPWDALAAWLSPSEFRAHLRASAIEYLARSESKGGMADVRKAHHCLAKALESYAQEGE